MRIETANAIYEDTFDSLVAKPGAATGKPVYECSYGNKIKVFVKDIHFKE